MAGEAPPRDDSDEPVLGEIEEVDLVKRIRTRLYSLNRFRGFRIVDVADWSIFGRPFRTWPPAADSRRLTWPAGSVGS